MANGNGDYPRKHVQVTLSFVIPQPLHFAGVDGQWLLVVMHMVRSEPGFAEVQQLLVRWSFVRGSGKVAFGQLRSVGDCWCGCCGVQPRKLSWIMASYKCKPTQIGGGKCF